MERIQPIPAGAAHPYFAACRENIFRLQHCDDCGHWQFYPRVHCTQCGAVPGWHEASGQGRIASFSVVQRALSPAYEAPYVVALIDLAEGPRMMSAIVGCDPSRVTVGAAVSVDFEKWSEEVTMPVFRLQETGGEP